MNHKDLVILVADTNMKFAISGLLERPRELQISSIEYDIHVHPHHDPGCLKRSNDFLRSFQNNYRYSLVIFDKQGCGDENESAENLEKKVSDNLEKCGWQKRCDTIVIDPELEIWIWNNKYQEIEKTVEWSKKETLFDFLVEKKFISKNNEKPKSPKETFEAILREIRKPRSSSIYKDLSKILSFKECEDRSFNKLVKILKSWFPKIV